MQSPSGHYRLAVVVGSAGSPRSYLVDYEGTIYRRSRQHLLLVDEPAPPPAAPFAHPIASSLPTSHRLPRTLPSQLFVPRSPTATPGPPSPASPARVPWRCSFLLPGLLVLPLLRVLLPVPLSPLLLSSLPFLRRRGRAGCVPAPGGWSSRLYVMGSLLECFTVSCRCMRGFVSSV